MPGCFWWDQFRWKDDMPISSKWHTQASFSSFEPSHLSMGAAETVACERACHQLNTGRAAVLAGGCGVLRRQCAAEPVPPHPGDTGSARQQRVHPARDLQHSARWVSCAAAGGHMCFGPRPSAARRIVNGWCEGLLNASCRRDVREGVMPTLLGGDRDLPRPAAHAARPPAERLADNAVGGAHSPRLCHSYSTVPSSVHCHIMLITRSCYCTACFSSMPESYSAASAGVQPRAFGERDAPMVPA